MSFPEKKVLRRAELDAFITTAIMPELMNADLNQELQVCVLYIRLFFCLFYVNRLSFKGKGFCLNGTQPAYLPWYN